MVRFECLAGARRISRGKSLAMHRQLAVLGVCLLTVIVGGCSGSSSDGDCVAPVLAVSQSTVSPGDEITLTGSYFTVGCNDAGEDAPEPSPTTAPVLWAQEAAPGATVAEASIDEDGELTSTIVVPADAAAGDATVSVSLDGATTAEVSVSVAE
ncbi:hypothetical protein [Cellulomonas sp. PSBB021]|uniref:hypothetical protein n=1 Tax=Cellulomonas sp. PSBB021 TaxID=2003551 RepID=UPI0012FE462D|nr:hypothetical protein [Cellulomonas sp. PSBB021]